MQYVAFFDFFSGWDPCLKKPEWKELTKKNKKPADEQWLDLNSELIRILNLLYRDAFQKFNVREKIEWALRYFTTFVYLADIDECAGQPCQNNGNCTDLVSNYKCACTPGYTGKNCSLGRIEFCQCWFWLSLLSVLKNQNQRNYCSKSQQTWTKQWTNKNSKQVDVVVVKRVKMHVCKSRT